MSKRIYRINKSNWTKTRKETKIKRLRSEGYSSKYADYNYNDLTCALKDLFDPRRESATVKTEDFEFDRRRITKYSNKSDTSNIEVTSRSLKNRHAIKKPKYKIIVRRK